MKRYSFDIETDGLLQEVTKTHCNVIEDVDTGEIFSYRPNEIQSSLDKLAEADVLIGHNIIGYDLPVLKKLYGFTTNAKIMDTLLLSRLSHPNRPMHPSCPVKVWDEHAQREKPVGPHTLMNLGYYAKLNKGDFGESASWEYYSEEMLEYCIQDVKVTTQVFKMLVNKELVGFSDKCIELEHEFAEVITRQINKGWYFDIQNAYSLEAELIQKQMELENIVHSTFKPLPKFNKVVQPRAKKDGELSSVGLKFLKDYDKVIPVPEHRFGKGGIEYLSGSFSRIDWPEFNLGSRQQIAEQLKHRGWKPKHLTEKGSVIIDESVLKGIKNKHPEAKPLSDYFMISKKQSMVSSWIEKYNEDTKRIHGYVNTLGAGTRRCTHSGPNVAQVPASKSDKEGNLIWGFDGNYGADCRKLFTVPKGYKQVGCDASGLELRMLSHYMNDDAYIDLILNGDIHTYNQKAAGLPTRDNAKTFI